MISELSTTTLSSSTSISMLLSDLLFDSTSNVMNVVVLVLSVGFLVWSFNVYRSYGSSDSTARRKSLKQEIEKNSFIGIYIPFFIRVSNSITSDIVGNVDLLREFTNKQAYIQELEEQRLAVLTQKDFSLMYSPDIVSALEKVLALKRLEARYRTASSLLFFVSIALFLLGLASTLLYRNGAIGMLNYMVPAWICFLLIWLFILAYFVLIERKMNVLPS